jgi:hypothetical protein
MAPVAINQQSSVFARRAVVWMDHRLLAPEAPPYLILMKLSQPLLPL